MTHKIIAAILSFIQLMIISSAMVSLLPLLFGMISDLQFIGFVALSIAAALLLEVLK